MIALLVITAAAFAGLVLGIREIGRHRRAAIALAGLSGLALFAVATLLLVWLVVHPSPEAQRRSATRTLRPEVAKRATELGAPGWRLLGLGAGAANEGGGDLDEAEPYGVGTGFNEGDTTRSPDGDTPLPDAGRLILVAECAGTESYLADLAVITHLGDPEEPLDLASPFVSAEIPCDGRLHPLRSDPFALASIPGLEGQGPADGSPVLVGWQFDLEPPGRSLGAYRYALLYAPADVPEPDSVALLDAFGPAFGAPLP